MVWLSEFRRARAHKTIEDLAAEYVSVFLSKNGTDSGEFAFQIQQEMFRRFGHDRTGEAITNAIEVWKMIHPPKG